MIWKKNKVIKYPEFKGVDYLKVDEDQLEKIKMALAELKNDPNIVSLGKEDTK